MSWKATFCAPVVGFGEEAGPNRDTPVSTSASSEISEIQKLFEVSFPPPAAPRHRPRGERAHLGLRWNKPYPLLRLLVTR